MRIQTYESAQISDLFATMNLFFKRQKCVQKQRLEIDFE